ncbi:MAG: transglycosylase family protein [Candidatus Saccharimonadales bacterium]
MAVVFGTAVSVMALHNPQAHAQSVIIKNQTQPVSQNYTKAPSPPPPVMVEVQAGDTLSAIATKQATSWQRIFDANSAINIPDLIYPSETLRIPAASESLTSRPLPGSTEPTAQTVPSPTAAPLVISTPAPTPAPIAYAPNNPAAVPGGVWNLIAQCESGGNWSINTGNGFYGGLQFTLASWQSVGGTGYPNQASRNQQIALAQKLQARQGWGAWPVCSLKAGV